MQNSMSPEQELALIDEAIGTLGVGETVLDRVRDVIKTLRIANSNVQLAEMETKSMTNMVNVLFAKLREANVD